RYFAAGYRGLWSGIFVLLTLLLGVAGTALLGWHRLTTEAPVATLNTRELGPQHYAVVLTLPGGNTRRAELVGDQWQVDARVIKFSPAAVVLGAPPLYRLDRLSGRYRNVAQENTAGHDAIDLASDNPADLWNLKRRFPDWLPWVDADYGSGAYLPLVDGGTFAISLAPTGGLVARPADEATAAKLHAKGW
ncbi:MAG: hypothetical protein ACRD06_08755, partial [Terriglobia bacterium]